MTLPVKAGGAGVVGGFATGGFVVGGPDTTVGGSEPGGPPDRPGPALGAQATTSRATTMAAPHADRFNRAVCTRPAWHALAAQVWQVGQTSADVGPTAALRGGRSGGVAACPVDRVGVGRWGTARLDGWVWAGGGLPGWTAWVA